MNGLVSLGFGASLFLVAGPALSEDKTDDVTLAERHMMEADVRGGVRSLLAPGTAVPKIGPDATELDYIRWAKQALSMNQLAEAELSLEWGQVRRRVTEEELALRDNKPPPPYDKTCERPLCRAMRAIGEGHVTEAGEAINAALGDVVRRGS